MSLPPSFYEHAFAIQDECNAGRYRIKNAFQTNATLMTPEWCQFFSRFAVSIGVSVDGPQFIHDKWRVDRLGKGTFSRTMDGVALLQEHGIPFHVLMVLTREALSHPDEVWRFCIKNSIQKICFNCEEIEGVHTTSSLSANGTVALYREFFRTLLRLRDEYGTPLIIRETDFFISFIRDGAAEIRSSENTPFDILSLDYQGNISTFSPELLGVKTEAYGDFIFGDAKDGDLLRMLDSSKLWRVKEDIKRGIERCREECDYFDLCGGGAPSNKFFENGTFDSTETMCCRLRIKALSDVVLDYLEERTNLR